MQYIDPATSLAVADPEHNPIYEAFHAFSADKESRDAASLDSAAAGMILSVSGWRKIFAADGDEESSSPHLSAAGTLLAAAAAAAFADHLIAENAGKKPIEIVLGMDSRPTGPSIADAAARIFLAKGIKLRHLFISAAPELMAYTATNGTSNGFFYVTASHNPIGHNGIKFGRGGGVIDRNEAGNLIERFTSYCKNPEMPRKLAAMEKTVSSAEYKAILEMIPRNKLEALDSYRSFTIMTAASTRGVCGQDQVLSRIRQYADDFGLGIAADLNGSARTCSIDLDFLQELGIRVRAINTRPGQIAHRIIPEGVSLNICRKELEQAYTEDPAFQLGYVPDNDGDRGNIVYIDEATGKAHILEAQEVFALAVLSELAFSTVSNREEQVKRAVVVNGPTSLRIDVIAELFGAEVYRSEVGEANSVNLAWELRDEGYEVRILGEGSNGGNITYPAAVRDPMNTLVSFIKLLTLREDRENRGLFRTWCEKSGQLDAFYDYFSISDIVRTLPACSTTGVSEPEAILTIRSRFQPRLKAAYETLFLERWNRDRDSFFKELGLCSWKEFNTEGTVCREGMGPEFRSGSETGGLKIVFYDSDGKAAAFIWMRGSGTEPVFRILADSLGSDPARERRLLAWHTALVREADNLASKS